jgi:hypothetical protein
MLGRAERVRRRRQRRRGVDDIKHWTGFNIQKAVHMERRPIWIKKNITVGPGTVHRTMRYKG